MFSKLTRRSFQTLQKAGIMPCHSDELRKAGDHWAEHDRDFSTHRHWTEIPAVAARIREKISGSSEEDLFGYVVRKYFKAAGRPLRAALSLGCGAGALEIGLTQYVTLERHDAVDISEGLIKQARENAAAFPYIHYWVDDLNTCSFAPEQYDLVLAHQSLHHVAELERLFTNVRAAMREHAIFVFDEYVGPRRFQWTDRQFEIINACLKILPDWLTLDPETKQPRREIPRVSAKQVATVDPTEAIRSDEIMAVCQKLFRPLEVRPYGGTVLHMLLHVIAGNFMRPEAEPWLELLFRIEDSVLPETGSDFVSVIAST